MATPAIEITYAAHTASCTFLLDSEGICRRIVMAPKGKRSVSRTAARCVGAQYVASLDGSAAGGLVEMPRVGAAMLFARVDENGRISLVRTSTLMSFESQAGEDPFLESQSVETSAPVIHSDIPRSTERTYRRTPRADGDTDPDYYDPSDRTQRIHALQPEDVASALADDEDEAIGLDDSEDDAEHEHGNDLATAEYYASRVEERSEERYDEPPARSKLPSIMTPSPATLRAPHRDLLNEDENSYNRRPVPPAAPPPVATLPNERTRGVLPRRSDPHQRAAAAAARAYAPPARQSSPRPAPRASDVQIARRRRG